MQQARVTGLWLLASVALLAGCSTTRTGDYSSLPSSPQLPPSVETPRPVERPTDPGDTPGLYADLLDRIRAGYALTDVQHAAVDREVALYRSQPELLDRTFRRGARYLHYIVTEIEKRRMPMELALLPVVESAFNPVAYSRSRASGLWQFMPRTGRHYGLEQTWWLDERRDVVESTQAALSYLQYLHDYFDGDWFLAIAAYNGGEGTVSRAMQASARSGRGASFFDLSLRTETRQYVPKLLAIRRLVADPQAFGLKFSPIPNRPYFDVVDPGRQVHIGNAAEIAGVSQDDMFALNPAYNRQTTPPNGPHRLLLPIERATVLRQAMLAPDQASRLWVAAVKEPSASSHYVSRGETLSSIARHYGVSIGELKAANEMRGSTIIAGQRLHVPGRVSTVPERNTEVRAAPSAPVAASDALASAAGAGPQVHTVRAGDTLWGIARVYGVTVPELAAANGIDTKTRLALGTRLTVPASADSYRRVASAPETTRMTYRVKRGDTLSQIAARFHVTIGQLMGWNGLSSPSSLRAGQRLILYVDPSRFSGG
jgi:membrane-bound lytic murein transglycosylase D